MFSIGRKRAVTLIFMVLVYMGGCDDSGNDQTSNPLNNPYNPVDSGTIVDSDNNTSGSSSSSQPPAEPISANFTAAPTSGIAALTVNFNAAQSSNITQYRWNFGDGTSALGPTQTHIYNQAGNYAVQLTVTDSSGNNDTYQLTVYVFASLDNSQAIVPNSILFYDNFEYAVGRDNDPNAGDTFKIEGGWSWVKAVNTTGSSRGYLYTTDRIPGYSGSFPGKSSNRVLVVESLPTSMSGQTDFYLQYGDENGPINAIPANVWFQFWMYTNYYDDPANQEDQLSGYDTRNKFIYPCGHPGTSTGGYPCETQRQLWMAMLGGHSADPYQVLAGDPSRDLFVKAQQLDWIRNLNARPENQFKLGQTNVSERLVANRWTLVKLHFDTSTTSGLWEAWMKPMGGQWVKVAEWIDGVTPNFEWQIPPQNVGGHRVFRMPSTVNRGSNTGSYDSWLYLDDFSMANSESELPIYPY
jgi:PKD repeat protein